MISFSRRSGETMGRGLQAGAVSDSRTCRPEGGRRSFLGDSASRHFSPGALADPTWERPQLSRTA